MSKKCIYCGAELEDDALFCDECGKKQDAVEKAELDRNEKEAEEERAKAEKEATELRAKGEAEAKEEAAKKAKEEEERKKKQEVEEKVRAEKERKEKESAELKAKQEAEAKAKKEAEENARKEAELRKKQAEEAQAPADAAQKAKEDAEQNARKAAESKKKQELKTKEVPQELGKSEAEVSGVEEKAKKLNSTAYISLICGILAWVLFTTAIVPLIAAPVGVFFGVKALKSAKKKTAIVGLAMNVIMVVIFVGILIS